MMSASSNYENTNTSIQSETEIVQCPETPGSFFYATQKAETMDKKQQQQQQAETIYNEVDLWKHFIY